MEIDIQKIVEIKEFQNGKKRFEFPYLIRKNIYKYLYDSGFRSCRINNKNYYLRLIDGEIKLSNYINVDNFFTETLVASNYNNCPDDISINEIINSIYDKMPIKKRELTKFLNFYPNKQEKHQILIQIDPFYKHDHEILEQEKMFKEWSFKKTVDKINSYSANNPTLYYRRIEKNNFLIANHYNQDLQKKHRDGFDFWKAEYKNEKVIGKKKSLKIEPIYYSGVGENPINRFFENKTE